MGLRDVYRAMLVCLVMISGSFALWAVYETGEVDKENEIIKARLAKFCHAYDMEYNTPILNETVNCDTTKVYPSAEVIEIKEKVYEAPKWANKITNLIEVN